MITYIDIFYFGVESFRAEDLTPEVKNRLIASGRKCTRVLFNVETTNGKITDKRLVY